MEWTIPIQTFDTTKVRVSSVNRGQKLMAGFSYLDEDLVFPSLSILLPPLPVKSYDTETGKLSLSLQGNQAASMKLLALQTLMLNTAHTNHGAWFPGERERSYDEIVGSFQPLVSHGCLHLYCPLSTAGSFNDVQVYSGQGQWTRGILSASIFSTGKSVRMAVRLQGLSFHQHPITKALTGKSRVQHRILTMYVD
jgi:hypothetical protein